MVTKALISTNVAEANEKDEKNNQISTTNSKLVYSRMNTKIWKDKRENSLKFLLNKSCYLNTQKKP